MFPPRLVFDIISPLFQTLAVGGEVAFVTGQGQVLVLERWENDILFEADNLAILAVNFLAVPIMLTVEPDGCGDSSKIDTSGGFAAFKSAEQ